MSGPYAIFSIAGSAEIQDVRNQIQHPEGNLTVPDPK
jgi:hypothetical protein